MWPLQVPQARVQTCRRRIQERPRHQTRGTCMRTIPNIHHPNLRHPHFAPSQFALSHYCPPSHFSLSHLAPSSAHLPNFPLPCFIFTISFDIDTPINSPYQNIFSHHFSPFSFSPPFFNFTIYLLSLGHGRHCPHCPQRLRCFWLPLFVFRPCRGQKTRGLRR